MEKWIIGIGGMKCASTWVYQCLREHPDIYMSPIKEIDYFNKYYDKGESWYLDNYKNCTTQKIKGEFSATYLYYQSSAKRIYNFRPNTKIIISIRNPIERAISNYKHLVRGGIIDSDSSFAAALKTKPALLNEGLYFKHLEPFYEYFRQEDIIIIVSEEIAEKPKKVIRELYSQIGVLSDFLPSVTTKHVSKGIIPRIAWMESFRRTLYRHLTNHGHGDVINILVRSRIPELYRRLNKKPEKQKLISDKVKSELISFYKPDVNKLRALTGLSLKQWNEF